MFVEDPAPVLPILEALKSDPEEYVRRSVANNLNDIAKDHPDTVAGIAKRWLVRLDRPAAAGASRLPHSDQTRTSRNFAVA